MANTSMNQGLPPRPPWPDADQGFCTMKPSDYFHDDENKGNSHIDKKSMEKKDMHEQRFCTTKPSKDVHEDENIGNIHSDEKNMEDKNMQTGQPVKKNEKRT